MQRRNAGGEVCRNFLRFRCHRGRRCPHIHPPSDRAVVGQVEVSFTCHSDATQPQLSTASQDGGGRIESPKIESHAGPAILSVDVGTVPRDLCTNVARLPSKKSSLRRRRVYPFRAYFSLLLNHAYGRSILNAREKPLRRLSPALLIAQTANSYCRP
jgi:hypothetical protein